MPHGHFHWNELQTRNAEKAMEFYGKTIGWTFDAMPMPSGDTYYICKQDGAMVAGIFTMSDPMFDGMPEHWFSYLEVDDVDAKVKEAVDAGGAIRREPFDTNAGRLAIVADSNGAVAGWITPS